MERHLPDENNIFFRNIFKNKYKHSTVTLQIHVYKPLTPKVTSYIVLNYLRLGINSGR